MGTRDIKLENCLVNTRFHRGVRHTVLKMCDFGYCKNIDKDSLPKSIVGTSAYLSLDILTQKSNEGYDAMLVDLWSCGVVLYYLLEGRFPFGTGLLHYILRSLHMNPFSGVDRGIQWESR